MNTEEFDRQQESSSDSEFSDREYNEESRRLNDLVREGEWDRLKHNVAYMRFSVERRITKAIDALDARIHQNNKVFGEVVVRSPEKAGEIFKKRIEPLRRIKEGMSLCMAGDFDKVKDDVREKVNNALGLNPPNKPNKPQLKPA